MFELVSHGMLLAIFLPLIICNLCILNRCKWSSLHDEPLGSRRKNWEKWEGLRRSGTSANLNVRWIISVSSCKEKKKKKLFTELHLHWWEKPQAHLISHKISVFLAHLEHHCIKFSTLFISHVNRNTLSNVRPTKGSISERVTECWFKSPCA